MATTPLPNRFLRFLAALAALIVVYGLQSAVTHALVRPDVSDFRVLYCGERAAVRERADPYHVEPLRACEHDKQLETEEPAWSVTPFPLPSYATAALSPLAFLPYPLARCVWIAVLVVAFGLAAVTVATLLDVSAFAIGLVFAPTLGILNLQYGEPVLIAVAALCLAGLAIHGHRPKLAALAAAVSMVEPHVGLPAALGLFAFVPEARRTLVALAAVLAAVGLLTLGAQTNLEYVRDFLPAQARAELLAQDQFSLSRLLYVLGVAPGIALSAGSLSYGCTTLFGLWAARQLVARSFTRALFVLVPVATAMLGGPFIHDVQIAAALPAAVVLARRYWAGRAAVALLALDWTGHGSALLVPAAGAAAGMSAVVLRGASVVRRGAYTIIGAAAVLALSFTPRASPPPHGIPKLQPAPTIASSDLSSVAWGWRIKVTPAWSQSDLSTAVAKIPLWAGLLLVPLSLLTFAARSRPATFSIQRHAKVV